MGKTRNLKRQIPGTLLLFILLATFILPVEGSINNYSGEDMDSQRNITDQSTFQIPQDYIHRPIAEFFTGLSCPSCMGGPHQDMEKLWEENYDDPAQPFTYVEFHELNGGGVDDLATDESRDRMRYYQPGVSGTPDVEFDGGYIKLGGFSTRSISYQAASQAIDDCKTRYKRTIDPYRPLQSLRSNFKYVELFVDQIFTGEGFAISVQATYLGMDNIISFQDLRGSLYVFMVEDNVEAYSKVEDKIVNNRNVFRDYAIKDQQFSLAKGETYSITTEWTIPDAKVPIKPGDLTAVAAVYDLDDTTSEKGNTGNDVQVPRCVQSATPKSTAYDKDNDLPVVLDVGLTYNGDLKVDAKIDDDDGISVAYILYNTEAPNATIWSYAEMELTGEELCDDAGVCYAYGDPLATVTIELDEVGTFFYMFLAYDGAGVEFGGLGAQGRSGIYNYTLESGSSKGAGAASLLISSLGWMLAVGLVIFFLIVLFFARSRHRTEGSDEEDDDDGYDEELGSSGFKVKSSKKPSKKLLGIILVIAVAIIMIASIYAYSMFSGTDRAKDFTLKDIDGNEFSLDDFNDKVVILDLMTTSCTTCIAEMEHLKAVHEKYGDKIVIITISVYSLDSNEDMREFKNKYGGNWLYARDTDDMMNKYSADLVPKTVIIDKNKAITFSEVGLVDESKLSEKIDSALSGSASPVPVGSPVLGLGGAAILVGVGVFFSPCAFPLLPGYMSYYLGQDESRRMRKAMYAGVAAALGLAILFILIGIIIGLSGDAIQPLMPLFEPIVGIVIIILGIILLTNYTLPYYYVTKPIKSGLGSVKNRLPVDKMEKGIQRTTGTKFTFKSVKESGYLKFFLYGVGYGAAGAGCTAPLILILVTGALNAGGFLNAFFIFLICALVMAILMITITLLVAASMGNLINKLKVSTIWIKRSTGFIFIIVGFYLVAYYSLLG